ncbi:MAG: prepilin-type N-terminal cleavage/methylation domain-containing protein [Polyangiaceae bacterium]|nr:prepilin-type N-terminal cleavage/methylation domain-containing protein [Polyangiaceae bacterium]
MKNPAIYQILIRAQKRSKARGVTLVEVLIVIAIMALIAGSAVFLVFPSLAKARIDTAVLSAQTIRKAAELHKNIDGADGCPTVDDLVNSRKLEKGKTNDPWGTPFKIECVEGDEIRVTSAGKDKKEGTGDDVRDDFTKADIERVAKL